MKTNPKQNLFHRDDFCRHFHQANLKNSFKLYIVFFHYNLKIFTQNKNVCLTGAKGVMVGIIQKSPVTTTLTNYPTMHQIPAANHAAVVTPAAVPLANQNGSIGLPVGQMPQNGLYQYLRCHLMEVRFP